MIRTCTYVIAAVRYYRSFVEVHNHRSMSLLNIISFSKEHIVLGSDSCQREVFIICRSSRGSTFNIQPPVMFPPQQCNVSKHYIECQREQYDFFSLQSLEVCACCLSLKSTAREVWERDATYELVLTCEIQLCLSVAHACGG